MAAEYKDAMALCIQSISNHLLSLSSPSLIMLVVASSSRSRATQSASTTVQEPSRRENSSRCLISELLCLHCMHIGVTCGLYAESSEEEDVTDDDDDESEGSNPGTCTEQQFCDVLTHVCVLEENDNSGKDDVRTLKSPCPLACPHMI